MKDCSYIEFGSVEVNANNACAPVWSRIAVCRGLYISQEQFLDFVLFLGNDYTVPLVVLTNQYATMQQSFNGDAQIIMQEWLAKVSKQKNVQLQACDLFAPPPAHYNAAKRNAQMQQIWELQFAMDYSRALYNLEPLHIFYEQARLTLPPAVPYSTGPVVTDAHRTAMQMMLQQLQQRSPEVENPAFRPQWEDLLAAYVYQKACALMMKSFPKGSFSGEHNAPLQLFDSVFFHTILRDLRASAGQNVPNIPISETTRVEPVVTTVNNIPTTIATPCGEPVSAPAHELELPTTPLLNAEHTNRLRILERKELLQKSLDDRLSTEERTALRQQGLSGFMPKKVLVELGLEYLVNKSLTKAEKQALREQSLTGSWKLESLTENGIEGMVPEINATPCLPAPQAAPFAHIHTSSSLSDNTGLHDQAHRGLSPHATPTLTKAEQNAERKAEKKAKRKAERRALRQDTMHAQPKHGAPRVKHQSPSYTASSPLLEAAPPPVPSSPFEELPIDMHREMILRHIQSNGVTIIHGETGCGKSSRLPQFLLEDAEVSNRPCKIFVAQPRRIGVVGMLKRLRPVLGNKVGMRMGHGVRDETEDTRLHYVTTGYLVQLVAHHPGALKRCTHIVIDEVHERSVDGDLICLLVRDLLLEYSQLRVILMSATINTQLYQDYFSQYDDGTFGRMDGLFVGVQRFPVEVHYLEDFLAESQLLPGRTDEVRRLARKVTEEKPLTPTWVEAQYRLVVALLRFVCRTGSTVLVFISGIDDITNIATLLEPYPQFLVCPLHSTTPEEEQDLVFEPTPAGNIKVVLATNMAESSVTIPDCDVVICLGTHKAVSFSDSLQRTHVAFGLLSRASATQRAGRTGRVRPGTVYRLYTKETYQKMREHELAEALRRPLDDVMLNMWTVLENAENFQGVTPFLNRLMEVPDVRYIDKSYEKLFEASLITFPSDDGNLTPAGRFVSALPLDLSLGRLLSYGVLLGVSAEAVVMAAALSLSRSPYRIANAIFLDPEQYNCQLRQRFLSEVHYDEGVYSEPIALLRLLCDWRALSSGKARYSFCHKNNLQMSVMNQFDSSAENLAIEFSRLQPRPYDISARLNFVTAEKEWQNAESTQFSKRDITT
eukprot:gene10068-11799_t